MAPTRSQWLMQSIDLPGRISAAFWSGKHKNRPGPNFQDFRLESGRTLARKFDFRPDVRDHFVAPVGGDRRHVTPSDPRGLHKVHAKRDTTETWTSSGDPQAGAEMATTWPYRIGLRVSFCIAGTDFDPDPLLGPTLSGHRPIIEDLGVGSGTFSFLVFGLGAALSQ